MIQTASEADTNSAADLRAAMVDKLVADGFILSEPVERAFRAIPRHLFVPPGTSLDDAYGVDKAPISKRDENGVNLSSVSAPWLQARMIGQAEIAPGMRVLEIGSGGYNAALLAGIVGEAGSVVTVDIDPDVTAWASSALTAAGYADRVEVVTADGEHGEPRDAHYDAIVVTVGAWDIPPSWFTQLADGGTLVLPLRMNTITRSLALRRAGDHWASTSAEVCGFVEMQGEGARAERIFHLPDPAGGQVSLRFDEQVPDAPSLLDGALATGPVITWSGIGIGNGVSFADLHLWLAGFLPGFCRVAASEGTELAAAGVCKAWFPYGGVQGDSFAILAMRQSDDGSFEFGARAYGPHAEDAAEVLVTQIQEWDRHGRDLPGSAFTYWPTPTIPLARRKPTGVFRKNHGIVTISWP